MKTKTIGILAACFVIAGCSVASEPNATSEGSSESGGPAVTTVDGNTSNDPTATSSTPADSSGTSASTADTAATTDMTTGDTTDTGTDATGVPSGPMPCQPQAHPLVGGFDGIAVQPAGGGSANECDVWSQDCPEGEKCNAWASTGTSWNALRCVPLDPNPDGVGDPCTVEGLGSGLDSCELGAMCFNVDAKTSQGTCIEMCSGSPAAPVCETANTTCTISNQDSLVLCQPLCNPLVNECPAGQGCYPVGDATVCAAVNSGGPVAAGEPCAFINACEDGSYCASPDNVPGCDGSGCCSPFCEVGDDSVCLNGQTCESLFPGGAPAECLAGVGICANPPVH